MMGNVKKSKKARNRLVFYILGVAWPIVQFLVFYLVVNLNSIILSMQTYNYDILQWEFVWFENFKEVFVQLGGPLLKTAMINTFEVFGIHLIVMFIPVFLSYYLFKKYALSSFFKVILFMPSVISSMALVLCYKFFVEITVPEIWSTVFGIKLNPLLSSVDTAWPTLIFFSIWYGLGANFLIYLGSMSSISESIIEAAQLDGVNQLQEFFYIVFPMIFPTFSTFVVTSFATLFTNQMHLFSFFGSNTPFDSLNTIGYYLYKRANAAGVSKITEYPFLSALGVVLTLIAMPLCFGTKWLLNKIGPKSE